MKKALTFTVILLFLGVAFAPSINANVTQNELVEFDVEFCGLGKKHTVKLTQQEADEVEQLFDDIEQRLSEVETREETIEIFKEAIVELDKYGLLGGLSIRHAQRLIISPYQSFRDNKFIQMKVNAEKLDDNENYCCLIAGLTDSTAFTGHLTRYLSIILAHIIYQSNFGIEGLIYLMCLFPFIAFDIVRPFHIGSDILFVQRVSGYVLTLGLDGLKFWKGDNLVGLIDPWYSPYTKIYCVLAVRGFIGIGITNYLKEYPNSFYIGWALKVKIDNLDE